MKCVQFRHDEYSQILPLWSCYTTGGTFLVLLPQRYTQWSAGTLLVGNVTRPIVLVALHLNFIAHVNLQMTSDQATHWKIYRDAYMAARDRVATAGSYFFRGSGRLEVRWGCELLGLDAERAKNRDCSRATEELLHTKAEDLRRLMKEHCY